MESYESSLAPAKEREVEFSKILEEALDPYLDCCYTLGKDLGEIQSNVFGLNCILATKSTLEQFSFTKKRVSKLEEQIEKHVKVLVEYEHNFFVLTSGLHPLLVALSDWNPTVIELKQPFFSSFIFLTTYNRRPP